MKRLWTAVSILALSALPVLAQESAPAGAEGAGAEPNIIWETLNFLILVGLLGWLCVKFGGPALRARSQEIREGLAAGERAKAEADARAAEVKTKLAGLDREIAAIRAAAQEEREREAERIHRDAAAEMERIRFQAEQEIASLTKLAKLEVQRFAATKAIQLAEQKIRARMSPDVQSALLRSFLADFPRGEEAAREQHAG